MTEEQIGKIHEELKAELLQILAKYHGCPGLYETLTSITQCLNTLDASTSKAK